MSMIESYQCDYVEHEIVSSSDLATFLEDNNIISYELYTGQDISEEEPEEESEEESEEEPEEPGS